MGSFNTLVAVADKTKFLKLSAVLQSHNDKIYLTTSDNNTHVHCILFQYEDSYQCAVHKMVFRQSMFGQWRTKCTYN